jgi:predicted nuclease of predicted toxin-antitoxin system
LLPEFFADEGVDYPLVQKLREKGFIVTYAAEEYIALSDMDLLIIAKNRNGIFLTKDKDFGELIIRNKIIVPGVVLIRIEKLNLEENHSLVTALIMKYIDDLPGSFTVIQKDKIRIRKINESG